MKGEGDILREETSIGLHCLKSKEIGICGKSMNKTYFF